MYLGCDTLVVFPRNAAVIAGQRMEMKCEVDSGLIIRYWSIWRGTTSETEESIFVNSGISDTSIYNKHFGVDVTDSGSGILYANSTTLDDAGIYICGIFNGSNTPQNYKAHLIVFGESNRC